MEGCSLRDPWRLGGCGDRRVTPCARASVWGAGLDYDDARLSGGFEGHPEGMVDGRVFFDSCLEEG